jgi:hypothetical protein
VADGYFLKRSSGRSIDRLEVTFLRSTGIIRLNQNGNRPSARAIEFAA